MIIFLITGCVPQVDPDFKVIKEQYKYDNNGRLISKTAPDGRKTYYRYNKLGLLGGIKYPDSWVHYEYDKNGNRIRISDRTGNTEYYYDAFDRLIGVLWRRNPQRLIVYDYDPWNRLIYTGIFKIQALKDKPKYRQLLRVFVKSPSSYKTQRWHEREIKFQQIVKQLKSEGEKSRERWTEYEVKYQYNILGNLTRIDTGQGIVGILI